MIKVFEFTFDGAPRAAGVTGKHHLPDYRDESAETARGIGLQVRHVQLRLVIFTLDRTIEHWQLLPASAEFPTRSTDKSCNQCAQNMTSRGVAHSRERLANVGQFWRETHAAATVILA